MTAVKAFFKSLCEETIYDNPYLTESAKQDLKNYKQFALEPILKKSRENESPVIESSGMFQNSMVISEMMLSAKKSVKIVFGYFFLNVSGMINFIKALEDCLKRGVEIDIICIDNSIDEIRKQFSAFLSAKSIRYYNATQEAVHLLENSFPDRHANFLLFDESSYFLITSPSSYSGFASFNDLEISPKFIKTFESLKSDSILLA